MDTNGRPTTPADFLTAAEFAQRSGVTQRHIIRQIQQGRLTGEMKTRNGHRQWIIPRTELERFMSDRFDGPPPTSSEVYGPSDAASKANWSNSVLGPATDTQGRPQTSSEAAALVMIFNEMRRENEALRRQAEGLAAALHDHRLALTDGTNRIHQAEAERLTAAAREDLARRELEAAVIAAQFVEEELEAEKARRLELAESQAAMARELAAAQDRLVEVQQQPQRPISIWHHLARLVRGQPARA